MITRAWMSNHFFGAVLLLSVLGLALGIFFTYFIAAVLALLDITTHIFLALSGTGVGSG